MNIFFLSKNPKKCARMHCDKHVVKMILETCQMLWTAFHLTGKGDWKSTVPGSIKIYKPTHKNHPTAIWIRSSPNNFKWAVSLASELCLEYHRRYGKIHACSMMVIWFKYNTPTCDETIQIKNQCKTNYPKSCTPPPLAMPQEYHRKDLVKSYRAYYAGEKSSIAKWKFESDIPEFMRTSYFST